MNKIFVFILLLWGSFDIYGQTYYYKLVKKIDQEVTFTNTAGGQFITFDDHICFDSDKYGNSVGNGKLIFDTEHSNTSKTYVGESYFGNTIYRFKDDLSTLNIIVHKNLIYVYRRSEPAVGVFTSSLIKSKENTSDISGPINSPYTFPSYGYTPPVGTGNNDKLSDKKVQKNIIKETCARCGGNKTITYNTYPPMFGLDDYKVRCNECGEYHLRSVGHTHITCPDCKGNGYKERTTYSYE